MKNTSRLAAILLALCLLLGLAACGAPAEPTTEATEATAPAPVQKGWVSGRVILDEGDLSTVGIIIEDAAGSRERVTTDLLSGFRLELDPGDYTLLFTHGPEYTTASVPVTVKSYATKKLPDVVLTRERDLYSKGWLAGDLHMHTTYSDGGDSVAQQLMSNISQGLYFGFLTDHNTDLGLLQWSAGNHTPALSCADGTSRPYAAFAGVEITTQFGHYQSLGADLVLDSDAVSITQQDKEKTDAAYDDAIREKIIRIAQAIRDAGGVPQINHPYSTRDMGLPYWDVVDYFDTIEIWNGVFVPCDGRYESDDPNNLEQNYRSKLKWYELLNQVREGGKFHAATGGTDNHDTTAPYTPYNTVTEIKNMADYNEVYRRNGVYSGVPTTYVYCPGEATEEAVLEALVAGHSFISNEVLVLADVNGASYGDTAVINEELLLNLDVYCREGLEEIAIVKNGQVVHTIPLEAGTTSYSEPVSLTDIQPGDWIVLEVFGTETRYAITNPIFFSDNG